MLIGFLTAFPLSVVMMYGVTDINAVVTSSLPSAEVFYQITESKPTVTFMMCWVILIYYCESTCLPNKLRIQYEPPAACLTSQWVTAGRMTWAFARDVSLCLFPPPCSTSRTPSLTPSLTEWNSFLGLLHPTQR